MNTVTTHLRDAPSWDPADIAAPPVTWPVRAAIRPLGDVVVTVYPNGQAVPGTPVVAPDGLDPSSGAIRKRRRDVFGAVYQVDPGGRGLRPGDLLVPPRAGSPVLLIGARHASSVFSPSFVAIRPAPEVHPIWLWGLLNSETGQRARASVDRIGRYGPGIRRGDLLGLEIPVPSPAHQSNPVPALERIERTTHTPEQEAVDSWWRTVDLGEGSEWKVLLATPTPEVLDEGEPLESLCTEIAAGTAFTADTSPVPLPGWLPVVDIKRLSSGRTARWVMPGPRNTIARVGDVVLAETGARNLATVQTEPTVLAKGTIVLRLREVGTGAALVRYLNGAAGHALRSILTTGAVIPRISRSDVARIPVPAGVLSEQESPPANREPLAPRLERVLWT